jgi:hypothetical protein
MNLSIIFPKRIFERDNFEGISVVAKPCKRKWSFVVLFHVDLKLTNEFAFSKPSKWTYGSWYSYTNSLSCDFYSNVCQNQTQNVSDKNLVNCFE